MLVPDGAYSFERDRPRFHRIPAPSHDDLQRLLDALIRRITRTLVRAGVLIEDPLPDASGQTYLNLEADSPLDELSAAAVRYRIVVGPLAGRKTMTLHDPTRVVQGAPSKPFTVSRDGFSLNAAVVCEPHQREKLARVCRYLLRPPIALERLRLDADGLVVYELKRAYADGTTHVLFEPLDFIARLAALVPRPRGHLIRFHGLFAPNARHRHRIVPTPVQPSVPDQTSSSPSPASTCLGWMQRLRRTFGIDLSRCPRCGGPLRVIGQVTEPKVIARILEHLQQRHARDPRAPPLPLPR